MKNTIDKAGDLKNNADARIKQIQSDKDLTLKGKADRIAEIRAKTNGELSALQNDNAKTKAEMRDKLHRNLFGLGYPFAATEADKQATRLNYRDALFRADTIADEAAALRMLGRAQMTGDRELAKAVAARSYEQGWNRALNDYAGQSEAIASNLQELNDFEHNLGNSQTIMHESLAFSQITETPEESKVRISGQNFDAE